MNRPRDRARRGTRYHRTAAQSPVDPITFNEAIAADRAAGASLWWVLIFVVWTNRGGDDLRGQLGASSSSSGRNA